VSWGLSVRGRRHRSASFSEPAKASLSCWKASALLPLVVQGAELTEIMSLAEQPTSSIPMPGGPWPLGILHDRVLERLSQADVAAAGNSRRFSGGPHRSWGLDRAPAPWSCVAGIGFGWTIMPNRAVWTREASGRWSSRWLRMHGWMDAAKEAQAVGEAGNPTGHMSLLHRACGHWVYRTYDEGLRSREKPPALPREAGQT
jgi:hypothetical protein